MKEKGFITIATGKEEYYMLARNLLLSYRYFCKEPLPFAILCDRENEYTRDFDDVLIYEEGASCSYLDKLRLGAYLPYEETIFIDADCLAYGDLNPLFDQFSGADDVSCFGRVLSLEDRTGWFEYENLGDLQDSVSYVVGLHGGIYYMKNGNLARKVMADAIDMVPDYAKYKFKGKFDTPGDEPLVALSMAVNQCHPIPHDLRSICCYWEYVNQVDLDITRGKARILHVKEKDLIAGKGKDQTVDTILMHWGTRFTRELIYQKELALLKLLSDGKAADGKEVASCKKYYERKMRMEEARRLFIRIRNRIKRTLKF